MVSEYNRRRRVIVSSFKDMGLKCFEPLGAFYVFPSIKSTGLTRMNFVRSFYKEEKVLVIPGNAFGECGEGFVRVCYSSSMENIIRSHEKNGKIYKIT